MNIKQKLYEECIKLVDMRLSSVQNHINDIQNSLLSETKSSAGDKHETGRAMLQLEREKAGNQWAEIDKMKASLAKINIDSHSVRVGVGSLVLTSKVHYFVAVSLGAIQADGKTVYAISPGTPIGKLLMGKSVGDEVSFNGNSFVIEEVI